MCSLTCILRLCQVLQQKSYSTSSKIRFTIPMVCAGPLFKRSFRKTKGITAQILQIYFEFEQFFVLWSVVTLLFLMLRCSRKQFFAYPTPAGTIFLSSVARGYFCCVCVVNNSNKLLFSFCSSCSKSGKKQLNSG